jgi:hypothetical protein
MPFKTTWHELAVRRMVRWAAENGFDRVAWPATAEQVARIEDWGAIEQRGDQWFIHGTKNVTAIVNRYLVDLPRYAAKFGKPFGAKVGTTDVGGKRHTLDRR